MISTPHALAQHALDLLRSGRADAARKVLESLTVQLGTSASPQALQQAQASLRRPGTRPQASLRQPAPRNPAFAQAAKELRRHVVSFGPERVAEILRVEARDLDTLLAGRVKIPPAWLRRLCAHGKGNDAA